MVKFADEAGGVELNQQLAQLVELRGSEFPFQFGLDIGDAFTDCSRNGVSPLGEPDAFEALVRWVVVADQVAELLHLSEQVVHRLLGHASLGCELRRAAVLRPWIAQDGEVGWDEIGEAGVMEVEEDSCDHGIRGLTQQCADQRWAERILRFEGQVT